MKEMLVIDVTEGGILQMAVGTELVGKPVQIPSGVSSITVIIRDSESLQKLKERREARRKRGKPESGRQGRGRQGRDKQGSGRQGSGRQGRRRRDED
jgi:hypothetical protein